MQVWGLFTVDVAFKNTLIAVMHVALQVVWQQSGGGSPTGDINISLMETISSANNP